MILINFLMRIIQKIFVSQLNSIINNEEIMSYINNNSLQTKLIPIVDINLISCFKTYQIVIIYET
jgi:hypothetical protein